LANHIILTFQVEKGNKYKISEILFYGITLLKTKASTILLSSKAETAFLFSTHHPTLTYDLP
jgi:outer membrane protein assembly factor BamA